MKIACEKAIIHISVKTIDARWCLRRQRKGDLSFMVLPTLTYSHTEEESIPRGQAKPEPVALAFIVRAEGHTLLVWPCCYLLLLMENFMKQGSVSPQTQTRGGQSAERGGKEGRRVQSQKTTLTGCRSDKLAEIHPQVNQQSIWDVRHE